jgi:tetratricopeptide (TPR) repeat protein
VPDSDRAAQDPTLPAASSATEDTLAASDDEASASAPSEPAAPRIRASQPSHQPVDDYAQLVAVERGHYVVLREIARGGMGRIHAARDRRLGREVAVKELLANDARFARRFEREARITARLQHPAIVSVHEAGVWPSGEPFYAMRLVTGRSLDEAIASAKDFDARVALVPSVLAVADAMAYAHGQRVIHRDLKPRNVVVGEFGDTVVIDWGLAKQLDHRESESLPSLPATDGETVAGDVLGTPAYMPPEQAAGEPVDERADVYAIGALLYHVLAGQPPYTGKHVRETLGALRVGPPRPVTAHAPDAPRELVAVVERAMARDSADRYATARELADDLRRFQTGQLVGAHRYSLRQLLARWLRRHRTTMAAIAAALVAGTAIGVFAVVRIVEANRRIETERSLAVKHQQNAEQLMSFMLGDLKNKLSARYRLDLLETVAREAASYYDARIDALSDEDAYLSATAHATLARVAGDHGDYAGERAELAKHRALLAGLVVTRPDVPKYQIALAAAEQNVADLTAARGDLAGALATQRAVLVPLQRLLDKYPDDAGVRHVIAHGLRSVASALEHQGDLDGAQAVYRDLEMLVSAHGYNGSDADRDRMLAHSELGHLLGRSRRDYRAALPELRQSLYIGEALLTADPSNLLALDDVAVDHRRVAQALAELNDLPAARIEAEAALSAASRLELIEPNEADEDSLSVAHQSLGEVLYQLHDYAGATAHYLASEQVIAKIAAKHPDDLGAQRDLSIDLNKLGDVQLAAKTPDAAIDSYREALAIRERLVTADPSNAEWRRALMYSHYLIGSAYRAMPQHADDALAELRRAGELAAAEVARNPTNNAALDDLARSHVDLAKTLAARHDLTGERAELHAALDIARPAAAGATATQDWRQLVDELEHALALAGDPVTHSK